jgi:hypothetical protein
VRLLGCPERSARDCTREGTFDSEAQGTEVNPAPCLCLVALRSLADSAVIGHINYGASRGGEIPILLRAVVALATLIFVASTAFASDPKVERMLKQLDPDARFEQICDLEAMQRIGKDKAYRPERTVVSALASPKVANGTMTGTGGAFKSKGKWFQFSFTCKTSPDHMEIQSFSYQIGRPIPEHEWEKSGLW